MSGGSVLASLFALVPMIQPAYPLEQMQDRCCQEQYERCDPEKLCEADHRGGKTLQRKADKR